jgi:hypothetical protein
MKLTLQAFTLIVLIALPLSAQTSLLPSDTYNGFDVSKSLIPKDEILAGGPPRDGIPAILKPKFETAKEAGWLKDEDLVTGIDYGGVQKAYPLRILVWHEAVNDEIGGIPVLVSYCPLCGSTVVFRRDISGSPKPLPPDNYPISRGKTLTFGISGLLYQSDVLFYDHQTESLWSQLEMKAVTGEMIGTKFEIFPSVLATWKEWKGEHPNTLVLSRDTGFRRDYDRDPYGGYENSPSVWFHLKHRNSRFHPKEKVFVVVSGDATKAYPLSELKKVKTPFEDKVGNQSVVIEFRDGSYVKVSDKSGVPVKSFVSYWFAWYTFKPDTLVFTK